MSVLIYIILGITLVFLVIALILSHNFNEVKKMFSQGNVCVTGLRGTGKDMLMSNVIATRKSPYISNMDYKCSKSVYIPLELGKLDVENNYRNFLDENIVPYALLLQQIFTTRAIKPPFLKPTQLCICASL